MGDTRNTWSDENEPQAASWFRRDIATVDGNDIPIVRLSMLKHIQTDISTNETDHFDDGGPHDVLSKLNLASRVFETAYTMLNPITIINTTGDGDSVSHRQQHQSKPRGRSRSGT